MLYEVITDMTVFKAQHDCEACMAVNCKMRSADMKHSTMSRDEHTDEHTDELTILVEKNGKTISMKCGKKETLLTCLRRNKMNIAAYCSGRGTCGKCKVRLLRNNFV